MSDIISLYADGGVIGSNPSAIGGTYAYRLVLANGQAMGSSGVVAVAQIGGPVTNNQTEMLALLEGLKRLPDYFDGTVYSDSQITLGRIFLGWKWKNIPSWMHKTYQEQRRRLSYWNEIQHVLLAGHPTKAHLAAGIGRHGYSVSEHNVWCDHECTKAGETFMTNVGQNIPSIQLQMEGMN